MAAEWRLPGFAELRELGSGAQGRVVLARDEANGDLVAIKYLAADRLGDERALERFRSEARTLAQVVHPHVAGLRALVETAEGAAIVMEAVDGVSLRTLLDRYEPMSPESALVILKGSLLGLAAAHAVGVIHRDYKPANVVVRADGLSKLIDFGIAGLAGSQSGSGTPAYMAPEQWEGGPAAPATDVYAATCVFFESVTGRRPYSGTNAAELMRRHLADPVPVEAVPEPVRPLVARGMAKDPADRPPRAAAFVAELEAVAG
ncbi:MAG TPA: serine/threonine-protein kinase, partial [Thermomonospora sp.]|nr:serine/threonine-protein kinase [Thermomonospora sp.]